MSDQRRPAGRQPDLGDMDVGDFRDAAHGVADRVADYLDGLERLPVVPRVRPGDVRAQLPAQAPARGEPLERILDDYARLIEPNVTHWQHPGFMAYFSSTASGPAILGEWLAAGLNSNVMFWSNAPASTELEQTVIDWLRRMYGLPAEFDGMLCDTASVSSLLALVAARHAVPGLDSRRRGLAGRDDVGPLVLYVSAEAHMSIDKAAIVIGVGTDGVRRVPVDEDFRMRPDALRRAIAEDRAAGRQPFCVVGTLGTTSSTSIDPAGALADICQAEGLWLHLDAAYGGNAAIVPEYRGLFAGWERAQSIVVNPHKWMFTPFDASLLLFRDAEAFRAAFSIVPDYISTPSGDVRNYNEYGIQLGRRFRALKLWMQIRWFGVEGLASRIHEHCRMAQELTAWVDADSEWERMAPVPLSTVCFRWIGRGELSDDVVEAVNRGILEAVNATGRYYLSPTRLAGRYTLRVTIGNPRQTMTHVRGVWEALREAAADVVHGGS